jgi:hypothetical protein
MTQERWILVPVGLGIIIGIELGISAQIILKPDTNGVLNGFIGSAGIFFGIMMIILFMSRWLYKSDYKAEW